MSQSEELSHQTMLRCVVEVKIVLVVQSCPQQCGAQLEDLKQLSVSEAGG